MEIHPYYLSFQKRIFDLVISLILLIILLPLFLLISLLVLITSGWPVFYHQKRLGGNKIVFRIFKFRTMYVGAEKNQWRYRQQNQAPDPMYKNWQDPRFVGIGKWLSRTGLDELPQLINIIVGNMSLVGPRPLPVYEAEKLNKSWDFRYQVKPGVFSQWSVNAKRHNSLKEWKKLEKETLEFGGIKYEVNIILKTLRALI
ncbi:sugar transferase [Patescibacteria group bacterium]|nr:sugar transferase [Patescibacteria group bacterium]